MMFTVKPLRTVVKFHPPVEFRGYVQIEQPENQNYGQ